MRKLADISSFEDLQNSTHSAMGLSVNVFNEATVYNEETVTLRVDFENNAEEWWDSGGADLWKLIAGSYHKHSCQVPKSNAEQFMKFAAKLPGWGDGPDYAKTPIIMSESCESENSCRVKNGYRVRETYQMSPGNEISPAKTYRGTALDPDTGKSLEGLSFKDAKSRCEQLDEESRRQYGCQELGAGQLTGTQYYVGRDRR